MKKTYTRADLFTLATTFAIIAERTREMSKGEAYICAELHCSATSQVYIEIRPYLNSKDKGITPISDALELHDYDCDLTDRAAIIERANNYLDGIDAQLIKMEKKKELEHRIAELQRELNNLA